MVLQGRPCGRVGRCQIYGPEVLCGTSGPFFMGESLRDSPFFRWFEGTRSLVPPPKTQAGFAQRWKSSKSHSVESKGFDDTPPQARSQVPGRSSKRSATPPRVRSQARRRSRSAGTRSIPRYRSSPEGSGSRRRHDIPRTVIRGLRDWDACGLRSCDRDCGCMSVKPSVSPLWEQDDFHRRANPAWGGGRH